MKLINLLKEIKKINFEQPVSNLYIKGWGNDANSNLRIITGFPNDRGFPIQTNGNLPKTHSILRSGHTGNFSQNELETIGLEITSYVMKYGSSNVKSRLTVYKSYKDKVE